jgi:hypothetical protein
MQDQDDASSSQSQENEASSPAKEMDTAADQDDASSSLDLHRSVIDSLDEVPDIGQGPTYLKYTLEYLIVCLLADQSGNQLILLNGGSIKLPLNV